MSQHHKLSVGIAVFISDEMSKIILRNSSNSKAASVVMKSLLYRYINKNEMQEFVIRFIDKAAKFYISSFSPSTYELVQSHDNDSFLQNTQTMDAQKIKNAVNSNNRSSPAPRESSPNLSKKKLEQLHI